MTPREKVLLGVVAFFLAFVLNSAFLDWVSLEQALQMNDVPAILQGYRQVPNLVLDSGSWWRGAWIQQGISAYRPLASYLYWIECWVGLRYGFIWVGYIGVLLLAVNALLAGFLTWRFTKSVTCVSIAIAFACGLRFYNWSQSTPDYWLAWFPIHQELLMNALLFGAILYFDLWQGEAKTKYLLGAWILYILGAFAKEHVYIFPAFAVSIALLRRRSARVELRNVLLQCAIMSAFVAALWFYRSSVLIDPRNPELKVVHLRKKPWLYLAFPLYPFMLTAQYWFPGLALLIFSIGGVLLRWPKSLYRHWLQIPYFSVLVTFGGLATVVLYCQITYVNALEAFWYLFEDANAFIRLRQLIVMVGLTYVFWLLWKYRKTEPTAALFTFLVLSYVPVTTYLGWHYTVPAAVMRSVYWAVVMKLVWLDISPLLMPRLARAQLPQALSGFVARSKSSPA